VHGQSLAEPGAAGKPPYPLPPGGIGGRSRRRAYPVRHPGPATVLPPANLLQIRWNRLKPLQ
jgi:hypothetical protein